MSLRSRLTFGFTLLVGFASYAGATTITIINNDAAGVGLNDPTVAAPIGGNTGTTLGQQRMIAMQHAADLWAAKINAPFTIKISANFGPLGPCGPSSGVIGSAGPTNFITSASLPHPGTFYPIALAGALLGSDLAGGGAHITASFNSNVGTSGCLTLSSWYLGLDGAEVGNGIDLVATLLHEFGHGLGFVGVFDVDSATNPTGLFPNAGTPDIFSFFTRDNTAALYWNTMSNAQRLTSKINTGNVIWDGANVTTAAATVLTAGKDGSGKAKLFMPNPVQPGSSLYHFDTSASPNQIMEPSIQHDLGHNLDSPNDLSARFMQDIGWPQPSVLAIPTNVVATATSATAINVTWTASAGATSYHVYRSNDGTNFSQTGGNIPCCTLTGDAVSSGKAYLYRVRAFNGSTESGDSNKDLAYAFAFTDPTITNGAGGTKVKGAHVTELRTAVNAVRQQLTGLGAGTYSTDSTILTGSGGTRVKRLHIMELRAALDAARSTLGLVPVPYTTGTITATVTSIKKTDITDLRGGVQ